MSIWNLFRKSSAPGPAWVDAAELQRRMDAGTPLLILDVRQPGEFTAPPGHLPGAVNLPLPELPRRIAEVTARRRPVVVVCKTDRRSARAAAELMTAGLPDVAVLRGGTDGWHRQGHALE